MRLIPLILSFILIKPAFCQSLVELSTQDEKILDSVAHLYLSTNGVPGMAIGVIKNNRVLYSKGLGVKDLETNEPVTNQTVFHMASISKPFVSTAILLLLEQGRLQLEDLVTHHLPYFKMDDKRYQKITLEHLLLHTSGIPDVGPSENYDWDQPEYDDQALERYVRSLAPLKLEFKPGRNKPKYSNTGYEILGDVIAKTSGTTFEDYVHQQILAPAKMSHSSFLLTEIPE